MNNDIFMLLQTMKDQLAPQQASKPITVSDLYDLIVATMGELNKQAATKLRG
jgi:hypothetical protein